jgi:hypothetical protein
MSKVNDCINLYEQVVKEEPKWALVSPNSTPDEIANIPDEISVALSGGVLRGELWLSTGKPKGVVYRE